MTRALHTLPWLFAAALIAAACSDSGEDLDDAFADIPSDAPVVDQDDLKFKPDELTVAEGEPVYFTNSETALHTVTIDGDDESGDMRRAEIFVWTFEEPGEYDITCDYHPQMRATITVEPAP